MDERVRETSAPPADLWRVVEGIGGVGLRRGRRNPRSPFVGDALDSWRSRRLRAEMRLPGLACREFHVEQADGGARLRQRATFHPRGLLGHVYWWAVAPFHGTVFGGMVRNLTRAAEQRTP